MKAFRVIVIFLVALAVQSCATLDKDECLTANWEAIGYGDGNRGYDLSDRFRQHRKACSEHGIKAEFDTYKFGHEQGIRRYCTAELGYKLGKNNSQLPGNCPADLISMVRKGYDAGHNVYLDKLAIRQEINSIKKEIQILDDELTVLIGERNEHLDYLKIAEQGLQNPNASSLEKVVFYTQRDQMRKLLREKDRQIDELDAEREQYQYAVDDLTKEIKFLDSKPMPILKQ